MNDLFVLEKARGTEVAEQLFKFCETFTKENGYAHMSWVTASDNKRAQRFNGWLSWKLVELFNIILIQLDQLNHVCQFSCRTRQQNYNTYINSLHPKNQSLSTILSDFLNLPFYQV